MTAPARRWAEALAQWAIPPEILDHAPETPWGCPTGLFVRSAEEAVAPDAARSPTARRALEALPDGGSVLDVGAGGGAASLPLAPPAARITAVDQSAGMLVAFAALAGRRGVDHVEVQGRWPDAAPQVELADVVVCAHVFYNVADLEPFVAALTAKARRRVVTELTAVHPQESLNPLWRRFHGLERPIYPTADDALAVVTAMGLDAGVERWEAPGRWESAPREELVTFARRRLCLPPERDPEVAEALDEVFLLGPRSLVTLWWDVSGDRPGTP
ncbi:MAG: class I SAM-dependent methyltransferase [Acidimicrobiia bacterium]